MAGDRWSWLKSAVRLLARLLYRIETSGLHHFQEKGGLLIAANHLSFLDPVLLWAYVPRPLAFVIDRHVAKNPLFLPFLRFAHALIEVDLADPSGNVRAVREMAERLKRGEAVVVFPEGRISTHGGLMKLHEGLAAAADWAKVPVVVVGLEGPQLSPWGRAWRLGNLPLKLFPRIRMAVLPPRRLTLPEGLSGKERRRRAEQILLDWMAEARFEALFRPQTVPEALFSAARLFGFRRKIVKDPRSEKRYFGLLLQSVALAELLPPFEEETLGLLLPNATVTLSCWFGLMLRGKTAAFLNYTLGPRLLLSCCRTAGIRRVITSRGFLARAGLEREVEALRREGIELFELEKLKIPFAKRLKILLKTVTFPLWYRGGSWEEPAVVLFTSGSEGLPKGVVLSHKNLLANIAQLSAVTDFHARDRLLSVLPFFHVFGLVIGGLMPLLRGVWTFLYPNPLHYRLIPELAYLTDATILFATSTFLKHYGQSAHPYDFYNLRYLFAGAEKLRGEVARLWQERFGIRILEGYGATETSPALAVNTRQACKPGTVGRFLPKISWRLEPVEGLREGGRLLVRGPNVMLGYLLPTAPGRLQPPRGGWYDTGDIVSVDEEGFVTILGRAKRFAKLGGEMVSLAAVEELVSEIWPDFGHAVVARNDSKKGERLVLVTECPNANLERLRQFAREHGFPELWLPKEILRLDVLPRLGSGKVDYPSLERLLRKEA